MMRQRYATGFSFSRALACGLGLAAAMALPPAFADAVAPSALLVIDQNRTTTVDRIVATWGDALVDAKAGLSKDELRELLTGLRADQLLASTLAGSLEGLRNVIANALTANVPVATGLLHTKALGDAANDLVYTPVVPCRIVDTVQVGGAIPGLTRRSFIGTTATNYTAQGGSATNCGIPTSAAAVQTIVTVVNPPAQGFLLIYPYNAPQPSAFTAVYQPNQISTTAVTIQLTKGQAYEFTAFLEKTTFIQVDVMGYFKAPTGATFSSGITVGAGTTSIAGNVGIGIVNPVSGRLHVVGGVNNAVFGTSTNGVGVYGASTLYEGVRGEGYNINHGAIVGVHNGGGIATYGTSAGTGVQGDSTLGWGVIGTSTGGSGVYGVTSSSTGYGVFGATSSGGGYGVYARNTSGGFALYSESHAGQARDRGGFVKAMAELGTYSSTIYRCYNGLTGSTAPPCGFTATRMADGIVRIAFGFQVSDRFFAVTALYNSALSDNNIGANYRPVSVDPNAVEVFTFLSGNSVDTTDAQFMIVVY